jgi:hypothetical protein
MIAWLLDHWPVVLGAWATVAVGAGISVCHWLRAMPHPDDLGELLRHRGEAPE